MARPGPPPIVAPPTLLHLYNLEGGPEVVVRDTGATPGTPKEAAVAERRRKRTDPYQLFTVSAAPVCVGNQHYLAEMPGGNSMHVCLFLKCLRLSST